MDIVAAIAEINRHINGVVWGPVMLALLTGAGVYFTVGTGLFPIAQARLWVKNTLGRLFTRARAESGAVTPFQAFTTAMAATAGTGNLVGVATAIVAGGPGALLWMWVSGFFGMMTKFAEIVLAIRYRERNARGEWVGGPMYYIVKGLGARFRWLAAAFAAFGAVCAFGIGNMTQINAIAGTSEAMLRGLGVIAPGDGTLVFRLALGAGLAAVVMLVIMGGSRRIGEATEALVPFIGLLTIAGCVVALILKADRLGAAFGMIFRGAFNIKAAGGGALGYTMARAVRFGVARGVFTNEAGLGSAPIAHAAADTAHPVRQGMWGIFEVFADTLVMCTLSGLVILTSGMFTGETGLNGAALMSAAFHASFGVPGTIFLTVSVLIFAYCTTLSWSLYGQRCFEYLFKGKGLRAYRLAFSLAVLAAAIIRLELAWDIADTLNGLMAVPNLIALLALSPEVFRLTKEFLHKQA